MESYRKDRSLALPPDVPKCDSCFRVCPWGPDSSRSGRDFLVVSKRIGASMYTRGFARSLEFFPATTDRSLDLLNGYRKDLWAIGLHSTSIGCWIDTPSSLRWSD